MLSFYVRAMTVGGAETSWEQTLADNPYRSLVKGYSRPFSLVIGKVEMPSQDKLKLIQTSNENAVQLWPGSMVDSNCLV